MRLLTRQTLDHIDLSQALIEETRRLLDDRLLWRRLESAGFRADDADSKPTTPIPGGPKGGPSREGRVTLGGGAPI